MTMIVTTVPAVVSDALKPMIGMASGLLLLPPSRSNPA